MPVEDRIIYEKEYHNSTFKRTNARNLPSMLVSGVLQEAEDYFSNSVREKCAGKEVLDYGCGEGGLTGRLLTWGACKTIGIDISPGMIERAAGVFKDPRACFMVMNGEQMEFADNSFDLVAGTAILHHLDLENSFREIYRVLKPGGEAVFLEPLGHNFLINLFRRLTPGARTPYEHPLKRKDTRLASSIFREVKSREFVFFTLLLLPLRFILPSSLFASITARLAILDRLILRFLPFLRDYCWITVLEMKK